jgi:hypothetical protein
MYSKAEKGDKLDVIFDWSGRESQEEDQRMKEPPLRGGVGNIPRAEVTVDMTRDS